MKKINLVLLLFSFAVFALLASLFLNTNPTMAVGIYSYCRGPLQNAFGANNDQFNCPLSGVNQNDANYPYICTDNWSGVGPPISGELYCTHYQDSSLRYNCIGSQAGSTNTGSEWWIEGCLLSDTQKPTITNFTATPASTNQINLSWIATDNVGVTQIDIQRSKIACGTNGCVVVQLTPFHVFLPGSTTSYSDTNGLLANQEVCYVLTVYDAMNNQTYTPGYVCATTLSDSTPPSNITNLSVSSCSFASCSLSWNAPGNDGNVGVASSYDMRYSSSPINDSNWTSATQAIGEPAPTISGSAQSMIVSGLSSITTYYFAIKSSDGFNISALSNTPTGTTAVAPDLTAPVSLNPNLQAAQDIVNSSSQINLNWNAYTDNVGVTGYRIERCQGIGCSNFGFLANAVSGTAYYDNNLPSSLSFSYRIQAYDAATNFSVYSNIASASTAAPPDTSPPIFTKAMPVENILPSGTLSVNLSGSTNEISDCRWSDSVGQVFDSMNAMSGGMNHGAAINNLVDGKSYYVKCRDTASTPNTSGDFLVFSVDSVGPDISPPQISNRQPSGVLPYFSGADGSGAVTISVMTNKPAYCRYSQNIDTSFDLMAANALNTTVPSDSMYQKYHFADLTGFNGLNYKYYVRCQDTTTGIANTSGEPPISFSVATPPNILPTVNLTAAPVSGDAPLVISASGIANDMDGDLPLIYSLDWGDGFSEAYAPGSSISHTYNNAGSYTMTLTVTDMRGGVAVDTAYITINASKPVEEPLPITGGICAVECDINHPCLDGFDCSPSHICVLESALDEGPVRSGGYTSLTDGTVLANFPAGTSAVIIGLITDVDAECRYMVDSITGNGTSGVDYNNEGMKQFSTSDYKNHLAIINIGATKSCSPGAPKSCGYDKEYTCPESGQCNSYGFSAVCRKTTGALAPNTSDYPIRFTIGAPELLSCVLGEKCPNGLVCPASNKCEPAPYTCLINQYFIKNNIPYLLDVCFPSLAS